MKNNFKGGMSSNLSAFDVAKKWKISPVEFIPILEKGTEHEMEHTDDKDIARRIALDHIVERLDYYDRLDKIEKMHLGGDMSKHLAPNGKTSNLTHEQWHLVRTPDFKGWFGFWDLYAYGRANEYYEPSVRKIAKELKENKLSAIEEVANFLSTQVTEDDVLIPMPSKSGISTDTKNLAEKISEKTGAKIFDCLVGRKRESIYQLKKRNEDVSDFDFEFQINCEIPKAKNYFIVDNVIATGITMKNALKNVMDKVGDNVIPLVYAIDLNYISKVVDENGEPLVVYHGTKYNFNIFEMADRIQSFDVRDYGAYFTDNLETAKIYSLDFDEKTNQSKLIEEQYQKALNQWLNSNSEKDLIELRKLSKERIEVSNNLISSFFSKNILNCFLNIRNPLIYDGMRKEWFKVFKGKMDLALENNNDGAIIKNVKEVQDINQNTFIVFAPNQIKLADGTNTTFDGNNLDIRYKDGGRTISQTLAPKSDRVVGSKTNPKGSASDSQLAKSITFNDSLLKAIENKVKAHNEEYPSKKVTIPTAKAVVRRGMGAYSKSHRPFITGGAPNSRQAWGLARLNKFLLKKRGVKVKSAYIQDDDLL